MLNIIKKSFKKQFLGAGYYFLGLFLYVWMITSMFPSMEKVDLSKLYGQFPKEFLNFFGAKDILSLSSYEGFISIEFLSLFFILIISFFVASSASNTIAARIENKSMDFSLSQPISRTKFMLSDTIVTLVYSALLVILTSVSMFFLGKSYNVELDIKGLVAFSTVAICLLWAIYGIAILFSSLLKNKITVASSTLSIVLAFYIFSAMTNIISKLKDYDKFSIFYPYDPQTLLQNGNINWHQASALLIIFVCCLGLSILTFNKKDI